MVNDWIETSLGNLLEFSNGKKSPERTMASEFPVYGSNGIIGYGNETNAKENTIIIGRVGTYCGSVYYSSVKAWVTDNAIKASALNNNNALYLYYLLEKLNLNNWREGSGQPLINQTILKNIEVLVPSPQEQKKIADILGSLDAKIELNRDMNKTLEAMGQALFKSWFVDFDPVIDNALEAGNPIPDELFDRAEQRKNIQHSIEDKTNRALFPNEFELTESMGWIPRGWTVGTFDQHSIITMGQSPKGSSYNTDGIGVPLINGPVEFGEYFTEETKWTTEPTKMCKSGDLIVCVRGSTIGRYVKSNGDYCIGRGVCSIRGKKSQSFSDYWFKSTLSDLFRFTTGSTFPSWSGPTIKSFVSIIPDSNILDRFENVVSPMLVKQAESTNISLNLSLLRNILLPKLLSGEIRVPEAATLVEDV